VVEWIVAVLIVVVIVLVGACGYLYAAVEFGRKHIGYMETHDVSQNIVAAIRQTQMADQANVATVAETIAASVKSMMGMDKPEVQYEQYPADMYDEVPQPDRAVPFAETDPYFNDDELGLAPDDMVAT
jgi:hypothetical protein